MKFILKKNSLYNLLYNISIGILLFLFFYKLHFQSFIPISGDELNSILVYSTNIKTIFLKNFPGNVTFFHFFGYIKTLLFGYDLISYRILTFVFLILHFWILKKIKYEKNYNLFFFLLLISNSFSFYSAQYAGYIFSSFIFIFIFYLIKENTDEKNNKLILILLFIQIYNHLVNIYLVVPIILSLFIFSNKKKFIYDLLLYYLLPVTIFYSISVILTGLSVLKVSSVSLNFVFLFLFENYQDIFKSGFYRIFFYEAFINAHNFSILRTLNSLFIFDKIILILFSMSLIISVINVKNKYNKIFSLIIFFHILSFFLIYKNPAPRIFISFYCFYIFIFLDYINNNIILKKLINSKISFLIFLILIITQLMNFDYLDKIPPNRYNDFNFYENKVSISYLKKECILINKDFSEIQKRNYYFNYINLCNKKFNLSEFLNYYRS